MNENLKQLAREHLFLLVGGNPLPNLVAARCLAKENAHIWLLYSEKSGKYDPGTQAVMKRLYLSLVEYNNNEGLGWSVDHCAISSSDNFQINENIYDLIKAERFSSVIAEQIGKGDRVGVHYTGGTKPMAVHVYRKLEKIFPNAIFTYLDPRELAIRVDRQDNTAAESHHLIPLLRDERSDIHVPPMLEITLSELANLHGFLQLPAKADWAGYSTPGMQEVCEAIVDVHCDPDERKAWRESRIWDVDPPGDKKIAIETAFAGFPGVCWALIKLCDLNGSKPTLRSVAEVIKLDRVTKFKGIKSCNVWFEGIWLEEYTWASLQQAITKNRLIRSADRNLLHQFLEEIQDEKLKNEKTQALYGLPADSPEIDFELDLAFLIGYQLFALSCIATSKKGKGMEHFFEVFVRASQLGGDEARFALVSCSDAPESWKKQLVRDWDAEGRIHVFGASELKALPQNIENWFKELANKIS